MVAGVGFVELSFVLNGNLCWIVKVFSFFHVFRIACPQGAGVAVS